MSLSVVANATVVAGTTDLAITPASGSTDTSVNFLSLTAKPFDAIIETPTGWTLVHSFASGATASGADSGSTLTRVYRRFGAIGVTVVDVTSNGTANEMLGHILSIDKASTELVNYLTVTSGADNTSGADYSATMADDLDLQTGDWVLEITGLNSDAGTPTAEAIAASGATFGSYNAIAETGTASGDDGRLNIGYQEVTAGSSTSAPTFSFTNASSSAGGTILMRLRAETPTIVVDYEVGSDTNPAISVELTGLQTALTYTVTRDTVSGEYAQAAVRGMDGVSPVTTEEGNVDYEAPLDQQLEYVLTIYYGDVVMAAVDATPSPISLRSEVDGGAPLEYFHLAFLKNVAQPSLNQRLALADFSKWGQPGRVLSNSNILGRKNPVVITDVTGGRKGSFSFLTWTSGGFSGYLDRDFSCSMEQMELLLESGDTLLFQTTSKFTGKDIYMKIEDISVTRLNKPPVSVPVSPDAEHIPCLLWELTFTEVDRPPTEGQSFTMGTWQDVLDDPLNTTWGDVNTRFASWLEVLQYYS